MLKILLLVPITALGLLSSPRLEIYFLFNRVFIASFWLNLEASTVHVGNDSAVRERGHAGKKGTGGGRRNGWSWKFYKGWKRGK